jgi:hypothetical protein
MIHRMRGQMVFAEPAPRRESGARQAAPQPRLIGFRRSLETALGDHPKASLLAALSLGVLLGWTIKRH